MGKREMEQLQKDRAALANNYLWKNRKAIVAWANQEGLAGLSFYDKADAYSHKKGQKDRYLADAGAFRAVAGKYQQSVYPLTLGDLLK